MNSLFAKIVFLVPFGLLSAQYSKDLKCGTCISRGFNFCMRASDGQSFGAELTPVFTCCKDDTCRESTDETYACSSTYSDPDYALTMCPQHKDKCGRDDDFELQEGDS